jgi:hypothetical protein
MPIPNIIMAAMTANYRAPSLSTTCAFGYDKSNPVLKGLNFEAKPGEMIGWSEKRRR